MGKDAKGGSRSEWFLRLFSFQYTSRIIAVVTKSTNKINNTFATVDSPTLLDDPPDPARETKKYKKIYVYSL